MGRRFVNHLTTQGIEAMLSDHEMMEKLNKVFRVVQLNNDKSFIKIQCIEGEPFDKLEKLESMDVTRWAMRKLAESGVASPVLRHKIVQYCDSKGNPMQRVNAATNVEPMLVIEYHATPANQPSFIGDVF